MSKTTRAQRAYAAAEYFPEADISDAAASIKEAATRGKQETND